MDILCLRVHVILQQLQLTEPLDTHQRRDDGTPGILKSPLLLQQRTIQLYQQLNIQLPPKDGYISHQI